MNLNLETVVEFDHNDNSADIQIIDKVRNFLDRVKTVIDKNNALRRSGTHLNAGLPSGRLKLTDFLKQALVILSSYEDRDLEDLVAVLNDEIMKFHYKGCKFHELFESRNVRRAMANNLEKMKNAKAKEVKKKINNMLTTFENKNFDLMQNMVVNYLNSLYGDKAESKFKVVLDKLSKYRRLSNRDDLDLVKIIRYALRSIVFDHYSRLNYRTRKDLKLKLDAFWANLGIPEKEGHHIWQFKPLDGDEKLDEEHGDGSGSVEVELHKTNKKRKPKKMGRERNKQTTRKHLTFITLYPEVITTLKGKRHKTKSTKSSKHLREQESTKRLKDKSKKPRAVRKIISEHEAVIDVRRDTLSRVFAASVEILHPASKEVPETTIAPTTTSKAHKRYILVQNVL